MTVSRYTWRTLHGLTEAHRIASLIDAKRAAAGKPLAGTSLLARARAAAWKREIVAAREDFNRSFSYAMNDGRE